MPLTLAQASAIFANLKVADTLSTALEGAALRLADAVQQELTAQPGGPHAVPWRQTGALLDSISHTVDGLTGAVGSNDPAAAPQELGTVWLAPRPFLAPVAATLAESIAQDIGAALAAAITNGKI